MKKTKIIALLMLVNVISFQVLADANFRSYREGRTDFDFSLNYFKTTSNFDSGGNKADLPSGFYLQTIDTLAQGRYVLMNDVAIFAGLNVSNASSMDTVATRTNSALNKVYLGSDFQFYNTSGFNLTGEISYLQNLDKIPYDTDSVLNSDGANEITALVGSTFNMDMVYPFLKGGVTYRTEGLSTLLVYVAGLEARFSQVALGGSINGYMTIRNDDKTSTSAYRDAIVNRVDAYSKKYYAINPNLTDSEIYFKYNFSKDLDVKVLAGYTITGSNTAAGIHAGATLSWGFNPGESSHKHSYTQKDLEPRKVPPPPVVKPTPKTVEPVTPQFKEDTEDGVNQNYFKPVAPSNEEYTDPEPKIQMKKAPTPPPANDSGYQIKLKKVKKKKKSTEENP